MAPTWFDDSTPERWTLSVASQPGRSPGKQPPVPLHAWVCSSSWGNAFLEGLPSVEVSDVSKRLWRGVVANLLFPSLYWRKTRKVCAPGGAAGWGFFVCFLFFVFYGCGRFCLRGEFLINPKLKRGSKGHLYKQIFILQLISNLC